MFYRIEITTAEYKERVEQMLTTLATAVSDKKPDIPDFIIRIHITKAFLEVLDRYDEDNPLHQEFKHQGVLDPPVTEYTKPQLQGHPDMTVMWEGEPTLIPNIPNVMSFSPIHASVN